MGIYRLALSVILGGSCFFLFAGSSETTTASYYGEKYRGKPTASGEPFNPDKLTAAMWDVPFGSLIEVHYHCQQTDLDKVVVVRINDRGPAKRLKRGIDLSKAAFKALAPLELGLIKVKLVKRRGK